MRTNIVLDDELVREAMELANVKTIREAIDIALRRFVRGGRGESHVALVDARRLASAHRLERERIHIASLEEAARGLQDVRDGRVESAREMLAAYRVKPRK